MTTTPKIRLNYMNESQIQKAFDEDKLSDTQIYYLQNRDEMKEYSNQYYKDNKNTMSLIISRRKADLKRRDTDQYKSYQEQYREDKREAFLSLSLDEQQTIKDMRAEDRRHSNKIKSMNKKKDKQKKQMEELMILENKYAK